MKLTLAYSPFGDRGESIFPFTKLYDHSFNALKKGSLDGADALLLWGGEDISPKFYKQKYHSTTQKQPASYNDVSFRDMVEWQMMHDAKERGIPIIGVCRGAQFLCVFAGGSLIQNVIGHYSGHGIVTYDGKILHAAANHHQLMNPAPGSFELLGWSEEFGKNHEIELNQKPKGVLYEQGKDPEVLWFPEVKGFAIQPHPEWMPENSQFVEWVINELKNRVM